MSRVQVAFLPFRQSCQLWHSFLRGNLARRCGLLVAKSPPATSTNTPTATPTDVSANTPTLTPTATPVVELTATMLPTDLPTATPVETPGSGGTATATPINTSTSATPTTIPATATPQSCWALNLVSAGSGSDPSVTPTQSTGCPLHSYTNGELITLVANPALGWRVKQWTGITETTDTQATATLIMPNAIHWVGVTYEKSCYPITLAAVGSGPLPLALPTNSTGCAAGQYVMGESITVQASPVAPQVVIGWQGTVQDSSVAVVNSVTMPAMNHSVSVIYGLLGETPAPTATVLSTSINTPTPNTPVPTATGVPGATSTPVGPTPSVTPTSQSTPTPTSCHPLTLVVSSENGSLPILSPSSSDGCAVGFYLPGEQITITAAPSENQSVTGWSGTKDDDNKTVRNQIIMPEGTHQVTVAYGKSQPTGQLEIELFLPLIQ